MDVNAPMKGAVPKLGGAVVVKRLGDDPKAVKAGKEAENAKGK